MVVVVFEGDVMCMCVVGSCSSAFCSLFFLFFSSSFLFVPV